MTDHITIGDVAPRIQYSGDGVQTVFTYPFPIFAAADIDVYLGDVLQNAGYTVAGAGQSAGGTVTFAAAPGNGTKVTLLRNQAIARTSDFQEGGAFRAKTINDELDRQTAFIQQVAERVDRALVAGPTDAQASLALPAVADRANRYLGFDAAGAPTTGPGGPILPVTQAMAPVIQAADPPAAFALLKQPASETSSGAAEIATQAETNTGTDDTRFVTPAKLSASVTVLHGSLGTSDEMLLRSDGVGGKTAQGSVARLTDSGTLTITGASADQIISNNVYGATLGFKRTDTHGSGQTVGGVRGYGKDSNNTEQLFTSVYFMADNSNSGSEVGRYDFYSAENGNETLRLHLRKGLYAPGASGGDKGQNTANFSAVYDDNSLLTCYVRDAAETGFVDFAKWDTFVPNSGGKTNSAEENSPIGSVPVINSSTITSGVDGYTLVDQSKVAANTRNDRVHLPARKFAARLGTRHDPTTIEGQISHWKEKKHLTPYPGPKNWTGNNLSTGEWIQRGVETDELLMLYIEKIEIRLKKIEGFLEKIDRT